MEHLYILKIGGKVIDTPDLLEASLDSLAKLTDRAILVHGGGRRADTLLQALGISPIMHAGRRITDAQSLEIVTMVYGGLLNKQLVASLQAKGKNAIGLSGADANSVLATQRPVTDIDYGFAGDLGGTSINTALFDMLLAQGMFPVLCPITHNGQGQLLNTNADTIAATLAIALCGTYQVNLIYWFEHEGVLQDPEDPASVIPSIAARDYAGLKASGAVGKGMVPKLDNAFRAAAAGVQHVCIGKAGVIGNSGTKIIR